MSHDAAPASSQPPPTPEPGAAPAGVGGGRDAAESGVRGAGATAARVLIAAYLGRGVQDGLTVTWTLGTKGKGDEGGEGGRYCVVYLHAALDGSAVVMTFDTARPTKLIERTIYVSRVNDLAELDRELIGLTTEP